MDPQRFSQLVAELDALLPRSPALVRVAIDDVFEEGEPLLAGNRAGYLRLGVELLKLADAPAQSKRPDRVQVDLRYLLDPQSQEGEFATFIRREDIRPRRDEEATRETATGRPARPLVALLGIALALFVLVSLVIGTIDVLRWLGASLWPH